MPRGKKKETPVPETVEEKIVEAPVEESTQTVEESIEIPKEVLLNQASTVVVETNSNKYNGEAVSAIEDKIHDVLRKAREEVEYCDDFINMKTGNMRAYESYRAELYEVKYNCRVLLESSLLKEHPELVKVPEMPVRPGKF